MSLRFSLLDAASRLVTFLERRRGLVLVGVAFLVLAAGTSATFLRRPPVVTPVLDVLAGGLMSLFSHPLKVSRFFTRPRGDSEEILALRREIEGLREASRENARLREMLQYPKPPGFKTLPGRVIGLDLHPLRGTAWINLGARSGLREGDAVLTLDGLAGVVDRAWSARSRVRLLLNENTPVSVRDTRSRVLGIVEWDPGPGRLRLSQVPLQADIALGDTLVSSGLGGVFAPGFPVGTVIAVQDAPGGLLKDVGLRPFASFHRLEEVFVLIPLEGPTFEEMLEDSLSGSLPSGRRREGAGAIG